MIMKKLNFLYPVVPGILLSFSGCDAPEKQKSENEQSSQKTNIIYIMADDMGYGDAGCYGQEIIKTPHIDKMASEGIKFTQHYAGTSVCAPSRCVLMTGKHTGHAVVRGNKQAEPHGQMPIPDETVTVAELLKDGGYVTGMIGKWGLGITGSEGDPNKQGWDFFYGYTDQVLAHNYYPEYLIRNGKREYLDNEVKYLDSTAWHNGLGSYSTKKVDYSHDLFTNEALNFIKDNKDTSFFLYIPYTIPHNNGEAPDGQMQEVPDYGMYADKDWPSDQKGYAAMITRMDKDIGQILQMLKNLGIDKNTFVVFTSDNGPMREGKHGFTKFFDSNGPLKGSKRDLYEGGIREPYIAWWPGKIQPGATSDHISAFWDFLPTACDIANVPVPQDVDGISMLSELTGHSDEQKKHEYLYWEFHEGGKLQALRKGKWKAVRLNVFENPDAPVELYDLSVDIGEQNNIADQHPDIVKEMLKTMHNARTQDRNWQLYNDEFD